jgi:murein DD-endopeptidase MepM/ murein hydrolase activator NlpD
LAASASDDVRSNRSRSLTIVPAPPPVQTGKLKRATGPADKGAPVVESAVSSGVAFVAGRAVRFSYRLDETAPVKVRIALVRLSDGAVVKRWRHTAPAPRATHSVQWKPSARDGRYAFRLAAAAAATGAVAHNAADDDQERDAFDVHGYSFPLHAHHEYGDGFGAARSGHSHEGQDVFARCGAGIYAARGGRVQDDKYHSAAGNYVVIDGAGTGRDFFYAHMREPSPLKVGDRVYTGQRIGDVGDTGDAVGCHLHFEMWTAPGWYEGGHPFDPARYLKRWDDHS